MASHNTLATPVEGRFHSGPVLLGVASASQSCSWCGVSGSRAQCSTPQQPRFRDHARARVLQGRCQLIQHKVVACVAYSGGVE